MAKKQKDQTISSVSDILGFILEQSEKPVDKRRPVNVQTSKVQSESEYVSALIDALALPGTFVSDQVLSTVQNLVDAEISFGTQDKLGEVKVRASDLPDFFENPDAFVDKLFEKNKNIAKLGRLDAFGGQMRSLAGSAYARKAELFKDDPKDMKNILVRAMGQSAMAGSPKDQAWMVEAAEKIMNEGHIATKLRNLQSRRVSARSAGELEGINKEINNIVSNYNVALNQASEPEDFSPLLGFRGLLKEEFKARSEEVLRGREVKNLSKEEYEKYLKAQRANNMVALWGSAGNLPKSPSDFKEARQNIKGAKDDFLRRKEAIKKGTVWRADGRSVDYSTYSPEQKRRELKGVSGSIRELNDASRALGTMGFSYTLGKAEGLYYGLQSTLGPGAVEALANGDFFDPKKGYFGVPTEKGNFKLLGKGGEVGFLKPKYQEGQKLRNNYNDAMTNLYYANPVTWLRSLVSGEAFAWMAYKQEKKLAKMWGVSAGDFTKLKDKKFWSFYKNFKGASDENQIRLLLENPEYRGLMGRLKRALGDKNSNLAKKFVKSEKIFNSLGRWGGFAGALTASTRFIGGMVNKFQGKFREAAFSILSKMSMFTKDKAAMAMLESWKLTGGQALTAAISQGIIGFLHLAGSAVAGPLGLAISLVISSILNKIAKVAIKVFIFALVGVFGIFILLGSSSGSKRYAQVDGYSRVVPGEVQYNTGFESYGGGTNGGGGGGGISPEFIPGDLPPGQQCLLTAGPSLPCSQGPFSSCSTPGYLQPSHSNMNAIDIPIGGNFAAPQFCDLSSGNCVVEEVGIDPRCGGYVRFRATYKDRTYNFFLLHISSGVQSGQKLDAGQAVVTIVDNAAYRGCSTGLHLHLEVQINNQKVNPRDPLNVDFGCSVAECPVTGVCYR